MTRHLTEDEVVLLYYGDAGDERSALEDHLAECGSCRQEFERTGTFLSAVRVPAAEPSADYERDVWRRIQPMLPEKRAWIRGGWFAWPKWMTAAAMAVFAFAAFSAGRWFERSTEFVRPNRPQQTAAADPVQTTARERELLIAVGAHLEHAQMVLTELANTKPSSRIDISAEHEEAQMLLPYNRLYRQTALQLEDAQVATLLDQLERLLLDLSHRPAVISPRDLDEIRTQIGPDGLLFKVRITGTELRSRETDALMKE